MKTIQIIFLLTLSLDLHAQSKSKHHTIISTQKKFKATSCHWTALEEKYERVSKNMDNVLCSVTGFDANNKACRDELPEYYYNIAPNRPGVEKQYSYIVLIPKGAPIASIKTLNDLKSSPYQIIGVFKVGQLESDEFIRFPFADKKTKE